MGTAGPQGSGTEGQFSEPTVKAHDTVPGDSDPAAVPLYRLSPPLHKVGSEEISQRIVHEPTRSESWVQTHLLGASLLPLSPGKDLGVSVHPPAGGIRQDPPLLVQGLMERVRAGAGECVPGLGLGNNSA